MEWLTVINRLLDLKIVQWGLLALAIVQIVGGFWFGIKYNALKLENALNKSTVADLSAALNIQNQEIMRLAKQYTEQKAVMDGAIKEAGRIAQENRKVLDGIKNIKLEGTCDEKVKQSLGVLNGW